MLIFYIAFLLVGLLGITFFGGSPLFCGFLLGISFVGGILELFARGRLRAVSKLLLPVCVVLCLFVGQTAREGGMEDYWERIHQAAALIEKENMDEGAALLDELDGEFGVTDLSCYARADINLWLEEYDEALKCMQRVDNQSDGRWYEYMEKILSRKGTEKALSDLENLYVSGAEKLPENGHLQYMAGLVKLSQGSYQSAAYCFQRAKDLGEAKGLSCYYMGIIRYELGDPKKAMEYFEEALKQGVDSEKESNIRWYMEKQGA